MVYLYQKDINHEISELFNNLGENIIVESMGNNVMTILDSDYYNPEPIDLVSFQELIQDDFV